MSPRVEVHTDDLVTLDVTGLARLIGDGKEVAERLRRTAADHGILPVRVAVAGTRTAAILLARARVGITVVPPGQEASALSKLPLSTLAVFLELETGWRLGAGGRRPDAGSPSTTGDRPEEAGTLATRSQPEARSLKPEAGGRDPRAPGAQPLAPSAEPLAPSLATLSRWGLATLGDLAALPSAELSERLGQQGIWWQRVARGEDAGPLVPTPDEERFEDTLELEWPIEGLEPLSFVLGRLLEPLCQRLERRDRGAAVLHVRLRLVTRATHARSLQLPAPMRDPRVLRTLLLLDLESHPAPAGIDAVTVVIEPTPGRIVQESLLTRALPTPEQMSTLLARLTALMGERRIGAPVVLDSHRPDGCALAPFRVPEEGRGIKSGARDPSTPLPSTVARGASSTVERLRAGSALGTRKNDVRLAAGDRRLTTSPKASSDGFVGARTSGGKWPPAPGDRLEAEDEPAPSAEPLAPVPCVALRRFRLPVAVSVVVDHGRPVSVRADRQGLRGGRVESFAGPWRTSGEWWMVHGAGGSQAALSAGPSMSSGRPEALEGRGESKCARAGQSDGWRGRPGWNREEWDVALSDGGVYRIFEDRDLGRWFIEGILD